MVWTWRYEDGDGKRIDRPSEAFSSQADAESWVGQTWRDLAASGITVVTLLEDNRVEYRMSLLAAGE